MKTLIALILLLFTLGLHAQDLRNTEWFEIKAERKDGSKIIDRSYSDDQHIRYYFEDDTVSTSIGQSYSFKQKFNIRNGILSIGENVKYHIDTITNIVLALTEIPKQELPDDKINAFIFINNKFIFQYLTETGQIKITGDSLIECNEVFSPAYKGELVGLFSKDFNTSLISCTLTGSIIMLPDGTIKNVLVYDNHKFTSKEIGKFISIINSTKGSWIMPYTTRPFQFKIDFTYETSYVHRLRSTETRFILFSKSKQPPAEKVITQEEKLTADRHFNKGVELFDSEKFDKAIIEFDKCINIDPMYLEAYYNKAYSYQKLGNKNAACETWLVLKEMGQKQGELLYDENCK